MKRTHVSHAEQKSERIIYNFLQRKKPNKKRIKKKIIITIFFFTSCEKEKEEKNHAKNLRKPMDAN